MRGPPPHKRGRGLDGRSQAWPPGQSSGSVLQYGFAGAPAPQRGRSHPVALKDPGPGGPGSLDSSRGPPPRSASVQNNPTGLFWPRLRGFRPPGGLKRGAQAVHFADVRFLAGSNGGVVLFSTCVSVRTGPATGRSSSLSSIEAYGFVSHCEAPTLGFQRFGLVAQIRGCGSPQPSYQPVFTRPPSRAHQVPGPFEGPGPLTSLDSRGPPPRASGAAVARSPVILPVWPVGRTGHQP